MHCGGVLRALRTNKRGAIMMINFNVPPYTGKEIEYMKEAIENQGGKQL